MPELTNLQVKALDVTKVPMERLDEISGSALWHAVNGISDPRSDGDAIAAFNAYTPPPDTVT